MPHLISITGEAATGKTTFAKKLSEKIDLPMISMDEIKEVIFDRIGHGFDEKTWHAVSRASFDLMFNFADEFLKAGQDIIIESHMQPNEENTATIKNILKRNNAKFIQIELFTEGQVLVKRFEKRLPRIHWCHKEAGKNMGQRSFEKWKQERLAKKSIRKLDIESEYITIDTTNLKGAPFDEAIKKVKGLITK